MNIIDKKSLIMRLYNFDEDVLSEVVYLNGIIDNLSKERGYHRFGYVTPGLEDKGEEIIVSKWDEDDEEDEVHP